jgi:Uma2 family endonuclease
MVTVEEIYLPLTLNAPGLTDAQFQEFCEQYPDHFLEYTSEGELIIMPPTDPDTSSQNAEIGFQLAKWGRQRRDGKVTDATGGFKLPSGARRSPDAAWISRGRLADRRCPEFIIELLSPFDRPKRAHAKMLEWVSNGVELGWLIDPRKRTVAVYRPNREPEVLTGVAEVAGEGPVEGFTLDLLSVWNA